MWSAFSETRVAAPPAAVWALWEDPARWRDWNERLAKTELHGPIAVGTTLRVRLKRSPWPMTFTIVAVEQGRLLTDEARLPGARFGHEHRIDDDAGRARVSHRLYFVGPAERLYGLLLGRGMRTAVAAFCERERSLAEAGADRV